MNDEQNSPEKIRCSDLLKEIQNKISFMKPYSSINLLKKEIAFKDLERLNQLKSNFEGNLKIFIFFGNN